MSSLGLKQSKPSVSDKGNGAELEKTIAPDSEEAERQRVTEALALQQESPQPPADAWKRTIGMFDNDPTIREISEAGRKIRKSARSI